MAGITLTKCNIFFHNIYSMVMLEEKLGGGTYGDVYKGKVINKTSNNDLYENTKYLPYDYYADEVLFFRKNVYAIKFFRDDLRTSNDDGIGCTTLRELSCLKNIGRHPNILRLIDVTVDRQVKISEYINRQIFQICKNNMNHKNDLQIKPLPRDQRFFFAAYEYCDGGDLKKLVQKTIVNEEQGGLSLKEAKWLAFQLLNGLAFLHNNKMFHRDLKPENIMLQKTPNSNNYLLKIGDLGLCRELKSDGDMTPTVCTIYYRPLEVLLSKFEMNSNIGSNKIKLKTKNNSNNNNNNNDDEDDDDYYGNEKYMDKDFQYGLNVDIWSAACIICELIIGKPLFRGVTEFDLIIRIINLLGKPTKDELEFFSSSRFYPLKEDFFNVHIKNKKDALNVITYGKIDVLGIDLLVKMLRYNPNDRITAADALSHPWFSDIRFDNLDGIGVYNWYVHCLKYYIGIKTFREIEQRKKNLLTTTMISHFLCKRNDKYSKIIFKLINDTFKNVGGYKSSGRRSFAIFADKYANEDKNTNGFIKRASIKVLNDMKEKTIQETKDELSYYGDEEEQNMFDGDGDNENNRMSANKRRKINRFSCYDFNINNIYDFTQRVRAKRNLSIPDSLARNPKKLKNKQDIKAATTTNKTASDELLSFTNYV
uniref:Cell division protein kinase 5 n=1 Tax=Piliocolobus tephrosceles TaxID=591936 RepID=A0A8C9H126_9PRIM